MISALVIDDEPRAVENLVQLIRASCPEIGILKGITEAREAHDVILDFNPDIVFLDIEMPYQNGFDLLARTGQANFSVIFTTAYDHYALQAIKCSALDYLLKPIDAHELKAAITKFLQLPRRSFSYHGLENLFENLKGLGVKRLAVPDQGGTSFVSLEDLVYLEADRNYTKLHLAAGGAIVSTRTLKDYELLLQDMKFYRVHYSYLVNLRHVKRYERGGYLLLSGNRKVEVARRRKEDLMELLGLD